MINIESSTPIQVTIAGESLTTSEISAKVKEQVYRPRFPDASPGDKMFEVETGSGSVELTLRFRGEDALRVRQALGVALAVKS